MNIINTNIKFNKSKSNSTRSKIGQKQNKFLDTMLEKAINTGINLEMKAIIVLNFIEDQVISLKDTLIKEDQELQAIKTSNTQQQTQESTGIATKYFDNLNQARNVVRMEE